MSDPEGGEFCAFLRPELPADRLHGLVVDSAGFQAQARWWADVYGAGVTAGDGWCLLDDVPGMPALTMGFIAVPEPKTVKNRIHWDVTVPSVAPLVQAGAVLLREPDDDIGWHVLATPSPPRWPPCSASPARPPESGPAPGKRRGTPGMTVTRESMDPVKYAEDGRCDGQADGTIG